MDIDYNTCAFADEYGSFLLRMLQCFMFYTCHCIDSLHQFNIWSSELGTDGIKYVLNMFCSVDRTDFGIQKSSSFNTNWYSHKRKSPSLRCEVSIINYDGYIVHINCPYRWG